MILFPTLSTDVNGWKVVVFTDASLCNINDGIGSTGGHIKLASRLPWKMLPTVLACKQN